tara:strand:- start:298 stop:672 length:375 start_codon:yes stop_codon:yes gene_type:complete
MKGSYSKVTISNEIIEELKLICKTAHEFAWSSYVESYMKSAEAGHWLFFKKTVSVVDHYSAEAAARDNHCSIRWYQSSNGGYFEVADCVRQYEDIIALSTGDDCYFDAELLKVLSLYMESDNET